jgi:hydrogenase 3 maturation protease
MEERDEEEMPKDWKKKLRQGLKGEGRLVILGVGNPLKGDDAAGLLCVEQVIKSVPAKARPGIRIFRTYDVPENYTGKIRKFKPTRILIIDAALAGLKPGDVFILEKEKIAIEEISSHKIPLMVLISYLEQSIGCKVTVLGIQAKDLSFGAPVTPIVKAAVKTVADLLTASLSPKTRRRGLLGI